MIASSEDALVCDMAETYGILDYRALPLPLAATLAAGLRETSRSKMKLSGATAAPDTLLLAAATDWLATLVWMQSEFPDTQRKTTISSRFSSVVHK